MSESSRWGKRILVEKTNSGTFRKLDPESVGFEGEEDLQDSLRQDVRATVQQAYDENEDIEMGSLRLMRDIERIEPSETQQLTQRLADAEDRDYEEVRKEIG